MIFSNFSFDIVFFHIIFNMLRVEVEKFCDML